VPHDERHWYRTFLRRSNKLTTETELIQRTIASISSDHRIENILDIGPADGEITFVVLTELAKNRLLAEDVSYTAIEPSGRHLDSIETQIAPALPTRKFTLLKHRVTDALRILRGKKFDLILLANVLYYVPEVETLLTDLAALLAPKGILFSLHDDFHRDTFLLDLLQTAKSSVDTRVVSKVSGLKSQSKLKIMKSHSEHVQIAFPEMNNEQWEGVESGESYLRDTMATDAVNLISFLVNRDMNVLRAEKRWAEVVCKVRGQLQEKGLVELCAIAQVLQS
jgi:SAM-dependent methyltransferase